MNQRILILSVCAALLGATACKKQEDRPAAPPPAAAPATATKAPVADDATDHVVVLAHHKNPKPTDPVRVQFDRFKVVKASFDPKNLEGGSATIELDLASLHTSSDERDEHLKSASYLDVGTFATATITIDHVKRAADNKYSADATVAAHGVTKMYPVTFDVLETKDDKIRIKAAQPFSRLDFGVGTDPAQNPKEQVAPDMTIEMVLTLAKT